MKDKIGILLFTRDEEGEGQRALRFVDEIKKSGYKPEIFYTDMFSCFFKQGKLEIFYDNKKLNPNKFKFFIPRYSSESYHKFSIVKFLNHAGIKTFNSPEAAFLAKNKRDSTVKLALKDLPIIPTGINYSPFFLDGHLKRNKNNKIVVKANTGSLGYNVARMDSHISFISFMEFASGITGPSNILIQPFIKANHEDYRIIIIGGKVVASMQRKAKGIEFRSNISKGGTGTKITPTKAMADLAVKATKVLDLDYAGVDIIKQKNKLMIIEVNANPMLGIENITNTNVVGEIVKYGIKKSNNC